MDNVQQTLGEIKDMIAKAAETNSTYTFSPTTRSVFAPQNLDEKIKFLAPIDTPLRNRFPRTKGMGQATSWKQLTSGLSMTAQGSLLGTNTAVSFADATAPNETSQTYVVKNQAYQLLGRKLEVGGLALASSKGRAGEEDMQTDRERIKMYEVMLGEEELLLTGDSNVTNQFDGLYKQITTNSGNTSLVTASGIGTFARTLYGWGAEPTLLVTSAQQLQALADDLEKAGSIQRVVISQGERSGVVGGLALSKIVNPVTGTLIDVVPSRFVGRDGLLLTEKSPAGEAYIEVEELIPMSRVDVPSATFSYISFVLEAVALKVLNERAQYKFTTGV